MKGGNCSASGQTVTSYPSPRYLSATWVSASWSFIASPGSCRVGRRILDPNVDELLALVERLQDHSGHAANLKERINGRLRVLRVRDLFVVLVDQPVQRIADRFRHVFVVERSPRSLVKVHQGELQGA